MFTSTGIVLKSFDYKEKARIITLFTKEEGILSCIVKRISPKSPHLLSLTTPFSEGEFSYLKGRSDLYLFQEGAVIESNLALRNNLSSLRAASDLVKLLLSSQLPGQSSPSLYLLLRTYLGQIPLFEHPESLIASFEIKLLNHEGLMPFHRDPYFSLEEWIVVQQLLSARAFTQLREMQIEKALKQKIDEYVKGKVYRE